MKRRSIYHAALTALIAGTLFGAMLVRTTTANAQTPGNGKHIGLRQIALADLFMEERYNPTGQRYYYRTSRSTRPISLAFLVRGTTLNSRADWQQRAEQDIESLRHPKQDSPESDLDADGIPDLLDRWPRDPNRH